MSAINLIHLELFHIHVVQRLLNLVPQSLVSLYQLLDFPLLCRYCLLDGLNVRHAGEIVLQKFGIVYQILLLISAHFGDIVFQLLHIWLFELDLFRLVGWLLLLSLTLSLRHRGLDAEFS
jgi:hypothetical protein